MWPARATSARASPRIPARRPPQGQAARGEATSAMTDDVFYSVFSRDKSSQVAKRLSPTKLPVCPVNDTMIRFGQPSPSARNGRKVVSAHSASPLKCICPSHNTRHHTSRGGCNVLPMKAPGAPCARARLMCPVTQANLSTEDTFAPFLRLFVVEFGVSACVSE